MRGWNPAGVKLPSGVMSTTVCPSFTSSSAASALPRITRNFPASRSARWPNFMLASRPTALRSSSGRMPRTRAPAPRSTIGEKAPRFDERNHGQRRRVLLSVCLGLTPVCHLAFDAGDGGVRSHGQHAAAQLALETVEHRQHDDQHRDAERQPDDRHGRDERHESAAMRGAQVTRAYLPFIGPFEAHSYLSASAGGTRDARNAG